MTAITLQRDRARTHPDKNALFQSSMSNLDPTEGRVFHAQIADKQKAWKTTAPPFGFDPAPQAGQTDAVKKSDHPPFSALPFPKGKIIISSGRRWDHGFFRRILNTNKPRRMR